MKCGFIGIDGGAILLHQWGELRIGLHRRVLSLTSDDTKSTRSNHDYWLPQLGTLTAYGFAGNLGNHATQPYFLFALSESKGFAFFTKGGSATLSFLEIN